MVHVQAVNQLLCYVVVSSASSLTILALCIVAYLTSENEVQVAASCLPDGCNVGMTMRLAVYSFPQYFGGRIAASLQLVYRAL